MILSPAYENTVTSAIKDAEAGVSIIDVMLTNKSGQVEIDVMDVVQLSIVQDFIIDYKDAIDLEVRLKIDQVKKMAEDLRDLYATITLTKIDETTGAPIEHLKPVVRRYRCIAYDPTDLEKKYHASLIQQTDTAPLTEEVHGMTVNVAFALESEEVYEGRRKQLSSIFRNVTIEQVIKAMAVKYGFKRLRLVKPDNTKIYQNLVVPPGFNFEQFFEVLQDTYGIYQHGCGFYFTGGTLHIYPKYLNHDVKSKITTHIFNVPKGMYTGAGGSSSFKEDSHRVVCSTDVVTKRLTEILTENIGNAIAYMEMGTESYKLEHSSEGSKVDDGRISVAAIEPKNMTSDKIQMVKYRGILHNPYRFTQDLMSVNIESAQLGWSKALPFVIEPHQKVIYHYESKDGQKSQQGCCASVRYLYTPIGFVADKRAYQCNAAADLYLDPDDYTPDKNT